MKNSELFITANGKKFPTGSLLYLKDKLDNADEDTMLLLSTIDFKDPFVMLIISWFVGAFGVDRFLIGDKGLGVAKLLTLGGCGFWALIDLFLISSRTRETNLAKLNEVLYR